LHQIFHIFSACRFCATPLLSFTEREFWYTACLLWTDPQPIPLPSVDLNDSSQFVPSALGVFCRFFGESGFFATKFVPHQTPRPPLSSTQQPFIFPRLSAGPPSSSPRSIRPGTPPGGLGIGRHNKNKKLVLTVAVSATVLHQTLQFALSPAKFRPPFFFASTKYLGLLEFTMDTACNSKRSERWRRRARRPGSHQYVLTMHHPPVQTLGAVFGPLSPVSFFGVVEVFGPQRVLMLHGISSLLIVQFLQPELLVEIGLLARLSHISHSCDPYLQASQWAHSSFALKLVCILGIIASFT